MDKITLQQVVPQVFADSEKLVSEVWGRELTLEKGRFYLVEADSGMGKSTFCSYLIGHRHDFSGHLFFDDRKSTDFSSKDWTQLRQCHISYLFQELRLFPELSVWENILVKNRLTNFATDEQISAWLQRLDIAGKRDEPVARLSFGQQQRVALIRSLAQPFDFLLADEPISHLDDGNSEQMAQLIDEEARRRGAAVVVTSIGKHMPLDYDRIIKL